MPAIPQPLIGQSRLGQMAGSTPVVARELASITSTGDNTEIPTRLISESMQSNDSAGREWGRSDTANRGRRRAAQPELEARRGPALLKRRSPAPRSRYGGCAGNQPTVGSSDANARKIVGYGLRNPFRITFRPGTSRNLVVTSDGIWEEVNRIPNATVAPVTNFGWPCYEGDNSRSSILSGYQSAGLNICTNLYNTGAVVAPYYAFQHRVQVVSARPAQPRNGSAITGLAFYNGGAYPTSYNGALFFADHSRNCIWVMTAGSNGLPDKTKVANL